MFGKFLLIALLCVSVAQVHGGELENAINNGLQRAKGMNENAKRRYNDAVTDADFNSRFVDFKTDEFKERGNGVQETSRQTLRKVAALVEQKAQENNRPESVFNCIRRNEENANREIETFTNRFLTDMERLRGTKQDNIETATRPYDGMENALAVRYEKAVADITNCKNPRCVATALTSYNTYLNSMFATIKRQQMQIATIVVNFQRDAKNYFTNSNRQISRVRSVALRAIRQCYYGGRREFLDFEDVQEF